MTEVKLMTTEEKENAESMLAEIQKRITDAFDIFDHEGNKTVDVREIGTIMRSLGCCPSEGDLHDVFAELEEEEIPGYIRSERFLPLMTQVLLERRLPLTAQYKPASEETLMKAFQTLDTKGEGFLTPEQLQKLMMEEGEPFTMEEMEEMLSAAVNSETNTVIYKDYIPLMIVEENNS